MRREVLKTRLGGGVGGAWLEPRFSTMNEIRWGTRRRTTNGEVRADEARSKISQQPSRKPTMRQLDPIDLRQGSVDV